MKTTLFVLCLLAATTAFAQNYGGASYVSSEPVIYQWPSHPAHAAYAPMSQERSVLAATGYSSAQGERPASDFPHPDDVALGTVARQIRKQHDQMKKAPIVWINY